MTKYYNLSNTALKSLCRTIRNLRKASRPFSAITIYNEYLDLMTEEQREVVHEALIGKLD